MSKQLLPAAGFLCLAVAVTWPLAMHLSTHLPGAPGGDTGVYVWNLWIFRHEILRHAHNPLTTEHIFSLTGGSELSVHNYTIFADLLGLPLIGSLGVVRTFNVVYMFLVALSGYAAYLLVHYLAERRLESWIAGAAFAASPFLVARGTAHFSLVAAAPLPLFVLCLLRTFRSGRPRDALLTGLTLGWAGYCDVYYPIYCVIAGLALSVHNQWVFRRHDAPPNAGVVRTIDGALIALSLLLGWRMWHGPFAIAPLGLRVQVHTLYTPVLAMSALVMARVLCTHRFHVSRRFGSFSAGAYASLALQALVVAAMVLSPIIAGLGERWADGRLPSPATLWRSSPAGMDVLDFLVPNPNNPLIGEFGMHWIATRGPLAFPEMVGSLSLVASAIVLFVFVRYRQSLPRIWIAFTGLFVALSLGPFIQIAGVNTFVPGPWAFLRYVPILGLARSPARFAVLAALGLSVLLGFALVTIRRVSPVRARGVVPMLLGLLAFELLPSPRPLYSADVPSVYAHVRLDADESLRLLDVPTGVRDGTSSIGDFSASSQYYQTVHRKKLIGGYQSRVSSWRKTAMQTTPVMDAIFRLSERSAVPDDLAARARDTADTFVQDACLGYVVIDRHRSTRELRRFAIDTLKLVPVAEDESRELFTPRDVPDPATCSPVLVRPGDVTR